MKQDTVSNIYASVKIIHDTVFSKGENAYDLVNKIDTMYTNAWGRLISVETLIFGLATIVIPLAIDYFRKRQYKIDKENYISTLDKKMEEKMKDLVSDLDKKLTSKIIDNISVFSESVEVEMYGMKATNFYLLAESKMGKKDYPFAFIHFVTAIRYAIAGKDFGNLKGVLKNVTVNCIPNLTLNDLKVTETIYSFKIDDLMKEIGEADKDRILFDEIQQFKSAIGKIILQQEHINKARK